MGWFAVLPLLLIGVLGGNPSHPALCINATVSVTDTIGFTAEVALVAELDCLILGEQCGSDISTIRSALIFDAVGVDGARVACSGPSQSSACGSSLSAVTAALVQANATYLKVAQSCEGSDDDGPKNSTFACAAFLSTILVELESAGKKAQDACIACATATTSKACVPFVPSPAPTPLVCPTAYDSAHNQCGQQPLVRASGNLPTCCKDVGGNRCKDGKIACGRYNYSSPKPYPIVPPSPHPKLHPLEFNTCQC
jgi:hypothetical protein